MPHDLLATIRALRVFYDAGEKELEEHAKREYGDPADSSVKQKRHDQMSLVNAFPRPKFDLLIEQFKAGGFALAPYSLLEIARVTSAAERKKLIRDAISGNWSKARIKLAKSRGGLMRPRTPGRNIKQPTDEGEAIARLQSVVHGTLKQLANLRTVLPDGDLAKKVGKASQVLKSLASIAAKASLQKP